MLVTFLLALLYSCHFFTCFKFFFCPKLIKFLHNNTPPPPVSPESKLFFSPGGERVRTLFLFKKRLDTKLPKPKKITYVRGDFIV